jgi:SAM-dependent methyltransferase
VQQTNDAVEFHSQIAADFHESYKADPNRRERIAVWHNYLARYAGAVSLAYDLGCGSGMLTCEIAPLAGKVIAIDGAEGMIAIARQNIAQRGFSNVSFRQARLPIADTSDLPPAGLVISSSVIEYLDDLDAALAFVRNLLAPGGTLLFSMSNRDSISRKLVKLVYGMTGRPQYFGFLRHFVSDRDVRPMLAHARLSYVDHVHFGGEDSVNRLLRTIVPRPMATNMILIVARRPVD